MTLFAQVVTDLPPIGIILTAMAVITLIEIAIPLHARGRWNSAHLVPNLALTFMTLALNLAFGAVLVLALVHLEAYGVGLLPALGLPSVVALGVTVVVLDFSFYVAHVAMHHVPAFWRFHRVHHSDPALDVTTTIRQHPGETVIRYAFMGAFAVFLGASPAALTTYRALAALNGLLEHANLRAPLWLDRLLVLVTTWPHMHKIHHSRVVEQTNSNYGNIFSVFDRLLGTYTPSVRGISVAYGLDGLDDVPTQTTAGLLALPFQWERTASITEPGLIG